VIRIEDVPAAPGVRLITFDRPEARNAFTSAMYDEATTAFREAHDNDAVRVVVVTGAGSAFTAGQDLHELAALAADRAAGTEVGRHGFPGLLDAISGFDKPLLAAVNGAAVGFGFTLLAHADVVFVADSARLRVPFVDYSVPPEAASSYLFAQRFGWQRAADILLTGAWVSASDAVSWGIALAAYPDDELMPAMLTYAGGMARSSLDALRGVKRLMQTWQQPLVDAALAAESDAYAGQLGVTSTIPDTAPIREGR
jgi:enoyl-CoA hydratase/carnithine racemase